MCVFLGANPTMWCSRKQALVARSNTEVEYRSLAATTMEILAQEYIARLACVSA